ncbi:MAG: TRAP transporter substrate-binding protein [Desulfobacter sp.]|nr:MAG: TRAP transporter substrate-binding protein [Desulfobacter sp.]
MQNNLLNRKKEIFIAENKRREFIKKVGLGAASVGVAGVAGVLGGQTKTKSSLPPKAASLNVCKPKSIQWEMVTTWPAHFPILGQGADRFARWVDEMSCGRLKIKVYGSGELVAPMEVFDTVSQGNAQMGHGAAYFWTQTSLAAQFFASVPFGFNAQQMNAWLYSGGGMALWNEIYAPFNLKPFIAGNTGVQMGGWFNKKINSMADFKGLKMRIPGLGAKVLERAGGKPMIAAGDHIYASLTKGTMDAAEWLGPFHDLKMGFHKTAKYYYYPGWHEAGTGIETMVNQDAWNLLPQDLKAIVEAAAYKSNIWMLSEFESKNTRALHELVTRHQVQLKKFPDPVLKNLEKISLEVLEQMASSDPLTRKVYDSFLNFRDQMTVWNKTGQNICQGNHYI